MIIISDTSPITNLNAIGQLDLLKLLFVEVIIPHGVYNELAALTNNRKALENNEWIITKQVSTYELAENMIEILDEGEAEAIALALELNADFLLIDERLGRSIAEKHGIKITGILGILQRAKSRGFIEKVQPLLDQLITEAGFRIAPKLYQEVLKSVGEG